jgi:hypothetical protein
MSSHSAKSRRKPSPKVLQAILTQARAAGILPLDYMLSVMNGPGRRCKPA